MESHIRAIKKEEERTRLIISFTYIVLKFILIHCFICLFIAFKLVNIIFFFFPNKVYRERI